MRTIKQILIILLVLLTVGQVATGIYRGSSDRKEPPVISCPEGVLDISSADDESALLAGITASDPQDGDLTHKVIVGGISKLISENTAKVTFMVFDSDDNMASCVRHIRYSDYRRPRFYVKDALTYSSTDTVALMDRLGATDVIDGNISSQIRVSTLEPTDNSEIYRITIQVTNSVGDTAWQELPVLIQPTNPLRPTIKLTSYLVYLKENSSFAPEDYVSSITVSGEALDLSDVTIDNQVDSSTPGDYHVYYTYNNNGYIGTAIMTVVVQ